MIKIQNGNRSVDNYDSSEDQVSQFQMSQVSKASASKIQYGTQKRMNYRQRDGDQSKSNDEEKTPDILRADYPCFVDE